jgi:aspartate kinase
MIVQSASSTVKKTDISFSVSREDIKKAVDIINKNRDNLKFDSVDASPNVAKISVVGMAMRTQPGVAKTMFETLAVKGVNLHVISTSEIKISVLIDAEYTELAVRSLHTAFGLDDES